MWKEKIERYVEDNRDEIIESIVRLVAIPSFKGEAKDGMPFGEGPAAALKEALTLAGELGFKTTDYDGYVGAIDLSDAETSLDVLGHLDVVPVTPADWTVCQPFEPVVKDGKIYGRGSADDKGPSVAALYAMKAVRDLGVPLSKNVRLLLGTDEECGGSDIEYYYKNNKPAPATFSPDSAFPVTNVEKGRLVSKFVARYPKSDKLPKIVSIEAGSQVNVIPDVATAVIEGLNESKLNEIAATWSKETRLKLTTEKQGDSMILKVKGSSGHAAYPAPANNALTGLLSLLVRLPLADSEGLSKLKGLHDMFPHGDWAGKSAGVAMSDDVSESLTICFNIMSMNEEGFSAQTDSRRPICSNQENTMDVLSNKAEEFGVKHEIVRITDPHHTPEDSPFVKTLLKAYEDYSGLKGECIITGGGTYVHGLDNAVAFGATLPGTENNMHAENEFAVVDEIMLCVKIFAQVIIDMCS